MSETVVAMNGYSFGYHAGTPVLDGIDLKIAAGERVALLGPNGAGKSTLLLALSGFIRGRGRLEVFGQPLTGGTLAKIRAGLGVLFQDPDDQLFMPTVLDNVAFGPLNRGLDGPAARARSEEALDYVGLAGAGSRLAHHLSQGQKRLVALASIVAMEPRLYLLDEPSAFLDPRGKGNLARLIRRLDASLLVASHDLEFVRSLCKTAVVLVDGRIAARGGIEEILGDDALLRASGLVAEPECAPSPDRPGRGPEGENHG